MKSYVLTLKFKDLLYSSQYVCVYGFGLIRMFFLVTFLLPGPGASQLWVEKSPHTDSRDLPASVFFFFFFLPAVGSRTIRFTSLGLSFPVYEWLHRVPTRIRSECSSLHSFTLGNHGRADCSPVMYNLLFVRVSWSTIGVHIKQCNIPALTRWSSVSFLIPVTTEGTWSPWTVCVWGVVTGRGRNSNRGPLGTSEGYTG